MQEAQSGFQLHCQMQRPRADDARPCDRTQRRGTSFSTLIVLLFEERSVDKTPSFRPIGGTRRLRRSCAEIRCRPTRVGPSELDRRRAGTGVALAPGGAKAACERRDCEATGRPAPRLDPSALAMRSDRSTDCSRRREAAARPDDALVRACRVGRGNASAFPRDVSTVPALSVLRGVLPWPLARAERQCRA